MEIGGLEQQMALVRFYFNEDYKYPSDEFFKAWGQLEFALQFEGKIKKQDIKTG